MDAHRRYMAANSAVDKDQLARVWDDDPRNVYFNLTGHNYRGLAHWSKLWEYYQPRLHYVIDWMSWDHNIWVEGDNRYDSDDSVEHHHDGSPDRGFMPMKNVVGRAILITWPVDRWTWLDNHPLTFADVGKAGDEKAGDDHTDESSAPTPTATTSGR